MNRVDFLKPSFENPLKEKILSAQENTDPKKIDQTNRLYQACEDFQTLLIKQMVDVMRKSVIKSDLSPHNQGTEIFEDMLYDQYARSMSKTSYFDLAKTVYHQISWLQTLPKVTS